MDPFQPEPVDVATFLASRVEDGLSFSTVNGDCSAIVSVLSILSGTERFASIPIIASVVRASKIANPPVPRYSEAWQPETVFAHWRVRHTDGVDTVLSESDARGLAISLFAIARFPRVSDMARLENDLVREDPEGLSYQFRGTKESGSDGVLTPRMWLPWRPASDGDPFLCPARALLVYRSMVAHKRKASARGFFLNLRDGSSIGAERISKCMQDVLKAAGVDTSVFKGNSGRMAGSSAAIDAGHDPESVLSTGRWSSRAVFDRFYNRAQSQRSRKRAASVSNGTAPPNRRARASQPSSSA